MPGEIGGCSVVRRGDEVVFATAVLDATHLATSVRAGAPHALAELSDHVAEQAHVLAGVQALHATTADGTALDATVIRPVGGGEGPWPTAVLVHGAPWPAGPARTMFQSIVHDGLLGSEFLDRFVHSFDVRGGRLVLSPILTVTSGAARE